QRKGAARGRPGLVPPEIGELARVKLGVTHRAVYAFVPKVVLQAAGVVPSFGQGESAGMAQHMRVNPEAETGGLASPRNQLVYAVTGKGIASFRNKNRTMARRASLTVQLPQGPQLVAPDRMRGWLA